MSGSSESTGPEFCGNSIVQWPEPTPRLGFAKGQQTSGATEFEKGRWRVISEDQARFVDAGLRSIRDHRPRLNSWANI